MEDDTPLLIVTLRDPTSNLFSVKHILGQDLDHENEGSIHLVLQQPDYVDGNPDSRKLISKPNMSLRRPTIRTTISNHHKCTLITTISPPPSSPQHWHATSHAVHWPCYLLSSTFPSENSLAHNVIPYMARQVLDWFQPRLCAVEHA